MKLHEQASLMQKALEQLATEFAAEGRPDVAHEAREAAIRLTPPSLARLYQIITAEGR